MKGTVIRLNEYQIDIIKIMLIYEIEKINQEIIIIKDKSSQEYSLKLWYLNELNHLQEKINNVVLL